jgi:polyketide biosynthesis acyl carrier protein
MSVHPASGTVPAEQAVLRAVAAAVTEILPDVSAEDIAVDRSLADLGADSVDRVEILSLLTHRLGRPEPISNFAGLPDIGALIDHLSEASTR